MIFYFLPIVILIIAVIAYLRYRNNQSSLKKIEEIKTKWAQPSEGKRNFKLISNYHNCLNRPKESILSEEIANDIDLETLFNYIDRTNSKPGQQLLYQRLRNTDKDIELLKELDDLSAKFNQDDNLRLETEVALNKLCHHNAYYIHELFTTKYNALYKNWLAIYVKIAGFLWIAMLFLTLITKSQYSFIITLCLTFVNFYIHYTNKKKITSYVHSIPQLYILMKVATKCAAINNNHTEINDSLKKLVPLKKNLRYISFQDESNSNNQSDLSSGFWELIKSLLLIEPAMFLISIDNINNQKDNIEILFNYIAKLDVAISILSLRTGLPYFAKPTFTNNGNELIIKGVFHPAIENCIPNSISAKCEQGILITGSNMSGKTTFIRSVMINALLSQTLFTACAESYTSPFMTLFTSIRITDSLAENKSYFQAEALSVLNILNKSNQQTSNLIIIDEIFKGTNTIERVAAAKAILSYLTAHKNFVFVSTHDLELAELLGEEYCCYSFEEKTSDTTLIFDYKIKPGILKNKNGIAVLGALGYPEEIVNNAKEISISLREKYNLL